MLSLRRTLERRCRSNVASWHLPDSSAALAASPVPNLKQTFEQNQNRMSAIGGSFTVSAASPRRAFLTLIEKTLVTAF